MNKINFMKILVILTSINTLVISSSALKVNTHLSNQFEIDNLNNNDVEYWALIVAANYEWDDNLDWLGRNWIVEPAYITKNILLTSDFWKEENIKMIVNHEVTKSNVVKGFEWLNSVADENDRVVISYYAHGAQLKFDVPPFDEKDRKDEYITTYWSGKIPTDIIIDDYFNKLLNSLKSNHVCAMINSCYSGGMNDSRAKIFNLFNPAIQKFLNRIFQKISTIDIQIAESKETSWENGFSEDIGRDGLIMLMASREHEVSFSDYYDYLNIGLQGYSDENEDEIVTAEEVHKYTFTRCENDESTEYLPTIYDNYPGDYILGYKRLPPEPPSVGGPEIVKINEECIYTAISNDPEGDDIQYGWDWDYDRITDDWTSFFKSGEESRIARRWHEPNIYSMKTKARDIYGAEKVGEYHDDFLVSYNTLVYGEDEKVDQYQIFDDGDWSFGDWTLKFAQSFKPSKNSISKVKIKFDVLDNDCAFPISLSIREKLDGDNITEATKIINRCNLEEKNYFWFEFIFPEKTILLPEETYYLVIETDEVGREHLSLYDTWRDRYERGDRYQFRNYSKSWEESWGTDLCFVTYE